jgi:amino acid adenylation domain-containing protein
MEPAFEVLIGILAALKAGAGYLPMDPAYPPERVEFMLQDADAPVLLTQASLTGQLPSYQGLSICLDSDWQSIAQGPVENPNSEAGPDNAAYVIYTSGSTGKPKGVVVTHRNVARLFTTTNPWFGFGCSDTWTLFHSVAFDFSVWEIWGALLYGGRLVIVPRLTARSPEQFHELLIRHQVTVLNQTPSAFRGLIAADSHSDAGRKLALRYVIFGGEALEFTSLLPWVDRHGSKPALINMYGITETTVHVTYFKIIGDRVSGECRSLIGARIPDLEIYVLDEHLRPAPIGVPGEMYVGGGGVARGYLNRPELTAERFIPHPFRGDAGARLYKTGDRARFLADGNLQYLGRIDQQVKIRGFRIELGEIETVLARHAGVKESIVIAREDVIGEKRLVAYVVPRESAEIAAADLRALAKRQLPEYMVPAVFVVVPALPLTSNGKVNRNALPAPGQERPQDADTVSARTPAEELIASIWADILRLDRVNPEESFFDLGGHSLVATQVLARLREAFQLDLPLRVLFEAPTVASLAREIQAMRDGGHSGDAALPPRIVPVPRDGPLPLSFAQQRLWFLDQLQPGNPLYNVPLAIRMRGALDAAALEEALNGVAARHEVLRTTFRMEGDQPVQVIAAEIRIPLPQIELTGFPESEREAEARRIAQEEAFRPFHLGTDPMIRALLLKLDIEDHILFLNIHHIASDGWSMGVFRRDLAAFYQAAVERRPDTELPSLPVQYADYAVWQRDRLRGEVLERQLGFWRAKLAGAPALLEIPADRPRGPSSTYRGAAHKLLLPAELTAAMVRLGRSEGATSFMTLLAAFDCLVLYATGQPDVVLGTDSANRTSVETDGLIGFFVNLLVMRSDLSGDPTFSQLLKRVREMSLDAYAHQEVPFEKLVEELQPARSMSHNPLVQVLFVQQNTPRYPAVMPGIELTSFPLEVQSKFDMAVFVRQNEEGIGGTWVYNADLFDASTVERMTALYRVVLETAVANPEWKLSALTDALANAEQRYRADEHRHFLETSARKLKKIRRKAVEIG